MSELLFPYDTRNLLPDEGEALYIPGFLSKEESDALFPILLEEISWKQEPIKIFGKWVMQPRLTTWYGDPGKQYTYSGITMVPHEWTNSLLMIKERAERIARTNFTSALLNLYRDGNDSMGWHRDNEKELGPEPIIGSVSLGARRKFEWRKYQHQSIRRIIELTHGSLLIMRGETQEKWQHRLPKDPKLPEQRINITFRTIR